MRKGLPRSTFEPGKAQKTLTEVQWPHRGNRSPVSKGVTQSRAWSRAGLRQHSGVSRAFPGGFQKGTLGGSCPPSPPGQRYCHLLQIVLGFWSLGLFLFLLIFFSLDYTWNHSWWCCGEKMGHWGLKLVSHRQGKFPTYYAFTLASLAPCFELSLVESLEIETPTSLPHSDLVWETFRSFLGNGL